MVLKKKKILIYQGGRYYNEEKTYNHFKNILTDYIVDCSINLDLLDGEDFFNYDTTIFLSQEGTLTKIQEEILLNFISSGKGFIGLHGASASFKNNSNYFKMLGGRFINHGSVSKIHIRILDKEHEITQNLDNFDFRDEPYRHDFSMGKNIHILAEAEYNAPDDPNPEPIMWIKKYGKGRVFFCALGHRTIALKDPVFQKIIERAVKWVLHD